MTRAINLRVAFIAMLGALSLLVYGLVVPSSARADTDGDAPAPPITSIGKIDMKYSAPSEDADDILVQLGLVPKSDKEPRSIKGWCTAWVVEVHDDTAYLMTAGHCTDVKKAAASLNVDNPDDVKLEVSFTRADNVNGPAAASSRPAQVIDTMSPENGDLTLLRIKKFPNEVLTPLPIASVPAVTGDDITATGFPKQPDEIHEIPDLLTTWGKVTSDSSSSNMNASFYMTIQSPVGGGMSGGPIMGKNGVVGVVSRGVPNSDLLQYVVDQENVERFLHANGITPQRVYSSSRQQAEQLKPDTPKAGVHRAQPAEHSQPVVTHRGWDLPRIKGWGESAWKFQVDKYNWAADHLLGVGIVLGSLLLGLFFLILLARSSAANAGGRHRRQ